MKITEIVWNKCRIEHIARHNVSPYEFESACFSKKTLVFKSRKETYCILGQSDSGRYLFCVVLPYKKNKGIPITGRDMTKKEKQRFNREFK